VNNLPILKKFEKFFMLEKICEKKISSKNLPNFQNIFFFKNFKEKNQLIKVRR